MIDLDAAAEARIAAGGVNATLRGDLGGYLTDGDRATVTVRFRDTGGATVGDMLQIGPVLHSERSNQTTLVPRSTLAAVAPGATDAFVTVLFENFAGLYTDGYADNLSLTLTTSPPPVAEPVARLNVSPNPSCAGTGVALNATASTAPDPIVRYEFFDLRDGGGRFYGGAGYDESQPLLRIHPNWERPRVTPSQPSVKGQFDDVAKFLAAFANAFTAPWIRPDIPIGLTITTSTNATASTSETLRFLQRSPEEPRTGCPADLGESTSQSFEPAIGGRGGKVMKKAVVTSVSCSNPTGCSGAVAMTVGSQTISGLNPGKTARAAKQGLVVIGAATSRPIRLARSLSPSSRTTPAPASRGQRIRARMTVFTLEPTGEVAHLARNIRLKP